MTDLIDIEALIVLLLGSSCYTDVDDKRICVVRGRNSCKGVVGILLRRESEWDLSVVKLVDAAEEDRLCKEIDDKRVRKTPLLDDLLTCKRERKTK